MKSLILIFLFSFSTAEILSVFKEALLLNYLTLYDTDLNLFHNTQSGFYSNLILKGEVLYLSGTDYVFKLNSSQINCNLTYRERNLKPTNKNDLDRLRHFNYIKFLTPRESTKDLIVCGTNLGKPHIYDLKELDLTNQLEYNGDYLCAGVANLTSLNLIDLKGISKYGVMYSGIWITERSSQTYGIFSRYGIFRKEIEINRHFLRSLYSPYWLWEPNFIAILQDNKYIYYFFTEVSLEHFSFKYPKYDLQSLNELSNFTLDNNSKLERYARVARICKNDKGTSAKTESNLNDMWTTFRKIRLECNCEKTLLGESSFSKQSYSLDLNNLKLIKQFEEKKLYGVFHEPLLNVINGQIVTHSILCEYDFNLMREKLEHKKFWLKPAKEELDSKLDDDFDCSYLDDTNEFEASTKINENLKFLSENTILDSSLNGECKLALPYKLTAFSINKLDNNETMFYMASSDSHLIRVLKKETLFNVLSIININKTNREILDILSNQNGNQLYLSTPDYVYQLNMSGLATKICNNYVSCLECNRDSYCLWNKTNCISISSKQMKQSSNHCLKKWSLNKTLDEDLIHVKIKINETLLLECFESLVLNKITINWFKDGNLIENKFNKFITQKGQLIIKHLDEDNAGHYSCEIENHHLKTFNVSVYHDIVSKCSTSQEKISSDSNILENMLSNWNKMIYKFNTHLEEKFYNCSVTLDKN